MIVDLEVVAFAFLGHIGYLLGHTDYSLIEIPWLSKIHEDPATECYIVWTVISRPLLRTTRMRHFSQAWFNIADYCCLCCGPSKRPMVPNVVSTAILA